MDWNLYGNFASKSFLFSFSILLVSFILGYLLYNYIILGKIKLRDALFEKDNLAAWIEFIGAFIFPGLFLAAHAVQGSASENILNDWLICAGYAALYIAIFTVLRLLSGLVVKLISPWDESGKISLNKEIYIQKNTAAALFSTALSVIFVALIRVLDFSSTDNFGTSLLQLSNILIFTLCALIPYALLVKRKSALAKELFVDNNPAAGLSLAGFIFAVEYLLSSLVSMQQEFDFAELIVLSAISLVVMGVISVALKWLFTKLIRVDIWKEVYEQNNVGASIGQIALYIGIANVIINFIK